MLGTVTVYTTDEQWKAYKDLCAKEYRSEADQLGFVVEQTLQGEPPFELEFTDRPSGVRAHQIRVNYIVSQHLEQLSERFDQPASRIAESLVLGMVRSRGEEAVNADAQNSFFRPMRHEHISYAAAD